MLNSVQIIELKKKDFYSSTYRLPYNIQYYSDIRTNFSFSFITRSAALVTLFKFIFCLFGISNIKKFAKFRNESIERVLNHDIEHKSVIYQLESNNWLNVEKNDFEDKMRVIKTSTDALYADSRLIREIKEILNDSSEYDKDHYGELFKMLLDDYDIIVEAWKDCRYKGMATIDNIKDKYNELKESQISSEKFLYSMTNGSLTQNIKELIELLNN